jgi:gas vesicle protein
MTEATTETTEEVLSEDSEMPPQQETPVAAETDKSEVWQKLMNPALQEQTPEPEPQAVEEEPTSVKEEKEKPEPKDELLNDPKLVKRFRDSQDFINKLKSENRQMTEQMQQLQKQMQQLQAKQEEKQQEVPATVEEVQDEVKRLISSLPEKVREEVEAFPELFAGVNALLDSKLGEMRKLVEPDLEQVRKERQQRQVQKALADRHAMANERLGITNARELDFDNPTFAQWVLSSDWRKRTVTSFDQPEPFVDLMRSFLYEYPEEGKSVAVEPPKPIPVQESVQEKVHRKTASTVVSRKSLPEKPKLKIATPQDKAHYWDSLLSGTG